jgi:hypothetical protein
VRDDSQIRTIVQNELRDFVQALFVEIRNAPAEPDGYITRDDLIACIRRVGRRIGTAGMAP